MSSAVYGLYLKSLRGLGAFVLCLLIDACGAQSRLSTSLTSNAHSKLKTSNLKNMVWPGLDSTAVFLDAESKPVGLGVLVGERLVLTHPSVLGLRPKKIISGVSLIEGNYGNFYPAQVVKTAKTFYQFQRINGLRMDQYNMIPNIALVHLTSPLLTYSSNFLPLVDSTKYAYYDNRRRIGAQLQTTELDLCCASNSLEPRLIKSNVSLTQSPDFKKRLITTEAELKTHSAAFGLNTGNPLWSESYDETSGGIEEITLVGIGIPAEKEKVLSEGLKFIDIRFDDYVTFIQANLQTRVQEKKKDSIHKKKWFWNF